MKSTQQQMISVYIKEARVTKGYTQKELSDLANISVRSIQRIENGDIVPRSYTLKTLSEVLGIPFENFQKGETVRRNFTVNKTQKIILSISISLGILLLSWAFIAQAPKFPETDFEFLVFSALILMVITAVLVALWRTKS